MPELPEVETVRRTLLAEGLAGHAITGVSVRHADVIRHPAPDAFAFLVVGQRIADIGRRGKYLLLRLSGGAVLVGHLRMTGRLWVSAPEAEDLPHTHVVFTLDDGRELRFRDVRRFGGFHLIGENGEGTPVGLAELGPEPADLSPEELLTAARRHPGTSLKALLLDQRVVAGLGNIYVDEALHRARVHPARSCARLTAATARNVVAAVREVLGEALRSRGTTFLDFRDGTGEPGAFQEFLRVYRRDGQACRTCGHEIRKTRVAGRGTHYCPHCQRGGKAAWNTAPSCTRTRSPRARTTQSSKSAR